MKAAIVRGVGQAPIYGDVAPPTPSAGERRIRVAAAALSHVAKSRASGAHYSASGVFPFVAGVDGVGTLDDGRRVYFALPHGAMAEEAVAPAAQCVVLSDDLDDLTAAAIANPGMSSWAAYRERARLQAGETVLVNGATGAAGRLAVQIAKHLGAGRVVATGRNREALQAVADLGADETIPLVEDERSLEQAFKEQFARGVDVVVDYLWGKSAERLLIAGAKAASGERPIRFVQVGSVSGPDITLPSAVLRASPIDLMGSGIGSVGLDRFLNAVSELFQAAVPAGLAIAVRPVPLSEVERAWASGEGAARIVFTP